MRKGCLTGLLILLSLALWAQGRPTGVGSGGSAPAGSNPQNQNANGDSEGGLFNRSNVKPDTFEANYFYLVNPYRIEDKQDTLLSAQFFQPDPAFEGPYAYANLGNLGSPATPLVYQMKLRDGFNMGFDIFDIYALDKNELPFFRLKSSFSDASFHQGRTQDDHRLNILHGQEFGKSLSFTIHHQRINHIGVFPYQKAFHVGLNTGFWYHHPDGRYQAFLTYTSNRVQHNDNGGYDEANTTVDLIAQEGTFPTFLNGPQTHHQLREFALTQYFEITKTSKKSPRDTSLLDQFPLLPADSLKMDSLSLDSLNSKNTRLKPVVSDSLTKKEAPLPRPAAKQKEIKPTTKPAKQQKEIVVPKSDSLANLKIDSLGLDSLLLDSLGLDLLGKDSLILDSLGVDSLGILPDSLQRNVVKKVIYYDPNYLQAKKRKFGVGHQFRFYGGFYKFTDESPAADSSFYGDLQTYNAGLQYRIKRTGIENSFFLFSSSIKKPGSKSNQQPRDFIRAGIKQNIFKLAQIDQAANYSNLSIFSNLQYEPVTGIKLTAEGGFYFLGRNLGDYFLKGDLELGLKKIGQLRAEVQQQLYAPGEVENSLLISTFPLWENDFKKTLETRIGGNLTIAWSGTEVGLQLNLLDKLIYFDSLATPQQHDRLLTLPQIIIKQPLRLKWLDFENTIVLQTTDEDVLPIPTIFTKHSLALKFKLFKAKRTFWLGAQGIFYPNYKARAYQPLIGHFYNRDATLTYYPQLDAFLGLQVEDFRVYLRMQNVIGYFNNEIAYRTPDYPIPYGIIRFGVSWRMLN